MLMPYCIWMKTQYVELSRKAQCRRSVGNSILYNYYTVVSVNILFVSECKTNMPMCLQEMLNAVH